MTSSCVDDEIDRAMIRLALKGDQQAYTTLIKKYQKKLYSSFIVISKILL